VLLASGTPHSRNYPANHYPFRASSHFLYFCGWNQEGCLALLEDGQCKLYYPQPGLEEAVWEGAGPDPEAIRERFAFDQLESIDDHRLAPEEILVIDPVAASAVGRPWEPQGRDAALAEAVVTVRLIHDEAGQRQLRSAADLTVKAHQAGLAAIAPGANELDVRAALTAAVLAGGGTTSFHPIVSIHGEGLHNHFCGNRLSEGDLLLIDFGAENAEGWAGDVTRTHPVSGKLDTRQAELYQVVLAANQNCIEACRPGAEFRQLHDLASLTITRGLVDLGLLKGDPHELVVRGAHTLFFPHGLGHLLGLDVHDMEDLGDRAGYATGRKRSEQFGTCYLRLDRTLEEGMALTIEPGFYWIPALLEDPARTEPFADCLNLKTVEAYRGVRGIRIEDDVLITAGGFEVLTSGLEKGYFS
jgi:Xaa-Pro aminopeptidase